MSVAFLGLQFATLATSIQPLTEVEPGPARPSTGIPVAHASHSDRPRNEAPDAVLLRPTNPFEVYGTQFTGKIFWSAYAGRLRTVQWAGPDHLFVAFFPGAEHDPDYPGVDSLIVDLGMRKQAAPAIFQGACWFRSRRMAATRWSGTASATMPGPRSAASWTQRRAPFEVDLHRFEGAPLVRPLRIVVTLDGSAGVKEVSPAPRGRFATGSFDDLDQSQQLNNKGFEPQVAGVRMASGLADSTRPAVGADLSVVLLMLPDLQPIHAKAWAANPGMASALKDFIVKPAAAGLAGVIKLHPETWQARQPDGAPIAASGATSVAAFQQARSAGGYSAPSIEKPLNVAGV